MFADGKPPNVLENEIRRLQLDHKPHEVRNQRVSGIFESPLADHAETLARSSSEQHIYSVIADAGMLANVLAIDVRHAPADRRAVWEMKLVSGAMHRIVLDGRRHIESGLFETKAHPTRAGE